MILAFGGIRSPFPDTEITHQKPYADFVGREYRVVSDVSAYVWNDFPDKTTIVWISLIPPPGVRNRFVLVCDTPAARPEDSYPERVAALRVDRIH
jgi:hypothetical protein